MSSLFGHEEAVSAFRRGLAAGRLHHAWLISGPQGIGKALFAEKAATYLLAEKAGPAFNSTGLDVPEDHPVSRLIAAGSHPDFVKLERLTRDGGTELARSITVDQVRSLQRLFSTTPSLSPWRAVIIDSVDDLEPNAANALLKNLEEPPSHSVFLLVSHAPERLLPTIRSRCHVLRLSPLKSDVMAAALGHVAPGLSREELDTLVETGQGAPGKALAIRGLDIAGLDEALRRLAGEGDPTQTLRTSLAQSLAAKSAQARYEAFLSRAPAHVAGAARRRSGPALAHAVHLWEKTQSLASSARQLSLDPQSVAFEICGLIAELAPASPSPHSPS